jgi:hypothetical protein
MKPWPASNPDSMTASLATKPAKGGTPARLSAGIRNIHPSNGYRRAMPPTGQARRAGAVVDDAADQEQRALEHDLVDA